MFCHECGKELNEHDVFCSKCGTAVIIKEETPKGLNQSVENIKTEDDFADSFSSFVQEIPVAPEVKAESDETEDEVIDSFSDFICDVPISHGKKKEITVTEEAIIDSYSSFVGERESSNDIPVAKKSQSTATAVVNPVLPEPKPVKVQETKPNVLNKDSKERARVTKNRVTKSSNKLSPKKKKLIIAITVPLAVVLCVIVTILIIINIKSNLVVKQFEMDVEILKSNDIDEINHLIFSEPIVPDEMKEYVEPTVKTSGVGIMSDLIALAEYDVVSKTETTITLSVEAPNMSGFGDSVLSEINPDSTADDIKQMILDYAENSDKITREVTLAYIVVDGVAVIDYNTPEFLNAVTGDFATGYAEIYADYIEALSKEVSDNA